MYFLRGVNLIIALMSSHLKTFCFSLSSLRALESSQGMVLRSSEPLQLPLKTVLRALELQWHARLWGKRWSGKYDSCSAIKKPKTNNRDCSFYIGGLVYRSLLTQLKINQPQID